MNIAVTDDEWLDREQHIFQLRDVSGVDRSGQWLAEADVRLTGPLRDGVVAFSESVYVPDYPGWGEETEYSVPILELPVRP